MATDKPKLDAPEAIQIEMSIGKLEVGFAGWLLGGVKLLLFLFFSCR